MRRLTASILDRSTPVNTSSVKGRDLINSAAA
jgi:hypothetical protein